MTSSSLLKGLFNFLYPPSCLCCGEFLCVGAEEPLTRQLLCIQCAPRQNSLLKGGICARCGEPEYIKESGLCLPCMLFPFPVHWLRSVYRYQNEIEDLVKSYKYGCRRSFAALFAESIAGLLTKEFQRSLSDWDMIVPVPTTAGALRKRGFHHVGRIAQELSRNTGIPADLLALRCPSKKVNQARLSIWERQRNVEGSFVADTKRVRQKKVIIIDDVLTTGQTVTAAAHALLQGGASAVSAVSFARSPHFQKSRIALALGNCSLETPPGTITPRQEIGATG